MIFLGRKAGFGKMVKNVRDAGFSRKRVWNAGSGPLLPDPGESEFYYPDKEAFKKIT